MRRAEVLLLLSGVDAGEEGRGPESRAVVASVGKSGGGGDREERRQQQQRRGAAAPGER